MFVEHVAFLYIYRRFRAMAEHCLAYSRSINLMIMLGFFTSTAMQRLFTIQTTIPGTAKSIAVFVSSLKPNLPEVSLSNILLLKIIPENHHLCASNFNHLIAKRDLLSSINSSGGKYSLGYCAFVSFVDLCEMHFQI